MNKNRDAVMKWVAPLLVGVVVLVVWHALVKAFDIPKYLVPSPAMVVDTLISDWGLLSVWLNGNKLVYTCQQV